MLFRVRELRQRRIRNHIRYRTTEWYAFELSALWPGRSFDCRYRFERSDRSARAPLQGLAPLSFAPRMTFLAFFYLWPRALNSGILIALRPTARNAPMAMISLLVATLRSGEFAPTPSIARCPRAGRARHSSKRRQRITARLRTSDCRELQSPDTCCTDVNCVFGTGAYLSITIYAGLGWRPKITVRQAQRFI